jgi:carbamoyltransferase
MYVLGVSALYHDSAACIIHDGEILVAAQEERFTRLKHDSSFPVNAIRFCLEYTHLSLEQIDHVAFYEKPLLKFERVLENFFDIAPKGVLAFVRYMPAWVKQKVFFRKYLNDKLKTIDKAAKKLPTVKFVEHHLSHAAWAYYTSPFKDAAVLTIDGVGEWTTTALYRIQDGAIQLIKEQHYPHSLGLLYSAFTQYLGFKVNDGEFKMMGLAPYGNSESYTYKRAEETIKKHLVRVFPDGSIRLNMEFFCFQLGSRMIHQKRWEQMFGLPMRNSADQIRQEHCDLALAIQNFTEQVVLKLVSHLKLETGEENLCLAGGVAYNCVVNGKIIEQEIFKSVHVPPAVGDAGSAVGAGFLVSSLLGHVAKDTRYLKNEISFLGPQFTNTEILSVLRSVNGPTVPYQTGELLDRVVDDLIQGRVVGWFQGRMEFGARALGSRSILADAANPGIQEQLNRKIKFRESFRPFAVILLEEDLQDYFNLNQPSPYMAIVAQIAEQWRKPRPHNYEALTIKEKCQWVNSSFPGIVHVDYSSRIQTVDKETNRLLYELLLKFKEKTGHSLLVNTSFNVNNEPIVCTPQEAYQCFLSTHMDSLAVGNFYITKENDHV